MYYKSMQSKEVYTTNYCTVLFLNLCRLNRMLFPLLFTSESKIKPVPMSHPLIIEVLQFCEIVGIKGTP